MLIDWFTVIAQALNFLILVWLLKRFLYTPVLNAIREREKKIKNKLQQAEKELTEAKEEKATFHRKNEAFEQKRESLLREASEEADSVRKQLLKEARKEAEALREQLETSLREEQENLSREIVERTQREVFAIARKVLSDLASANLEGHIISVFLQHLQKLEGPEKEPLEKVLRTSPDSVTIRTAFDIPQAKRREMKELINKIAGKDIQPRFEGAPRLIGGVELSAGGYKISWSIRDYVRSLEKKIDEMLNEHPESMTKTAPDESSAR